MAMRFALRMSMAVIGCSPPRIGVQELEGHVSSSQLEMTIITIQLLSHSFGSTFKGHIVFPESFGQFLLNVRLCEVFIADRPSGGVVFGLVTTQGRLGGVAAVCGICFDKTLLFQCRSFHCDQF